MNEAELGVLAAKALKEVARSEQIKQYIQESEELYPLLFRAAQRFIVGDVRSDAVSKGLELIQKGYAVSMEYIGENISGELESTEVKKEILQLIRESSEAGSSSTISLDLSHIGLMIDEEIAYQHLTELACEANRQGRTIMISAEESTKTNRIIRLYKRVNEVYSNVGITVQAYLHRTEQDIEAIRQCSGRIRLVKGAYQEQAGIAMPRSEPLDTKYVGIAESLVATGRPISIATHDEAIIEELRQRGVWEQPNVELEMLYGVRPDLLRRMNAEGYRARVYLTYGEKWHLYFFHRLSEYPPNVYRAIADMVSPSKKDNLYELVNLK